MTNDAVSSEKPWTMPSIADPKCYLGVAQMRSCQDTIQFDPIDLLLGLHHILAQAAAFFESPPYLKMTIATFGRLEPASCVRALERLTERSAVLGPLAGACRGSFSMFPWSVLGMRP